MERKPLVIYHKDCADGVAAAWCFWKQYGDSYDYHEGVYNAPLPDILDRDIYMVDFSYKRDIMQIVLQYANSVTLLDHHASALEDLWDLCSYHSNFDMTRSTDKHSGAMLAWNYVKEVTGHKRSLPLLIKHIQDRDMWKFELPHTREIMSAVFSHDMTFQAYDKLMKTTKVGMKALIKEGEVIERKYQKDLKSIIKHSTRRGDILGHNVPLLNANGLYASDAGNILSENEPFAAIYYDTAKHRVFSLRSRETGLDVSEIASKFNGGGHKRASGFKVDRDHSLAKI